MRTLLNKLLRRDGEAGSKGFSLIELLVSATIATMGMYASLSLCMSALRGNTETRDISVAGVYAEHVLNTIQAEAVMWQTKTSAMPTSRFLQFLPEPASQGASTGWRTLQINPFATDKRVGDMGDDSHVYDSGMLFSLPSEQRPRYCGQFRLTWVTQDIVRAEVRVGWARPHVPIDKYKGCPDAMYDDIGNVVTVTLPALVQRNVYAQ